MARKYRKRSHGGKKRGPKKGYRQSAKHKAAISRGLKRAWKAGKFRHRKRRRGGKRRHSMKRRRHSTKHRKTGTRKRRAGRPRKRRTRRA